MLKMSHFLLEELCSDLAEAKQDLERIEFAKKHGIDIGDGGVSIKSQIISNKAIIEKIEAELKRRAKSKKMRAELSK